MDDDRRANLRRARRVAGLAAAVTLTLAVTKWAVGSFANSPALQADAVDSTTDTLALATSWIGLRIAAREPTEQFPYGFYRAESLGALIISALIMAMGGRYLWEGLRRFGEVPRLEHSLIGLAAAAVSIAVALGLYLWERKVGRETGSQSLTATAEEVKLDMGKSGAVFVALICSHYRLPYVESMVTLLISGAVIYAGFRNMRTAVLSLMDAQIAPELEQKVADIIANVNGVRYVELVRARRAGPFYFIEGHVHVTPGLDVRRSHALAHEAQDAIREAEPRVEGVVLHVEPYHSETEGVLVPISSDGGLSARVCEHFGRAPYFLLATVKDEEVKESHVEENDFQERVVRAGLAVIREFVEERELGSVIVREIGEIAFHGLRDNAVDLFRVGDVTAGEALEAYGRGELEVLPEPTHTSDEKV
ncbi:MAG: cation diffusion facilitator family transporter [Planctomycetota bacterium]